jgi:hypothetical protein
MSLWAEQEQTAANAEDAKGVENAAGFGSIGWMKNEQGRYGLMKQGRLCSGHECDAWWEAGRRGRAGSD